MFFSWCFAGEMFWCAMVGRSVVPGHSCAAIRERKEERPTPQSLATFIDPFGETVFNSVPQRDDKLKIINEIY